MFLVFQQQANTAVQAQLKREQEDAPENSKGEKEILQLRNVRVPDSRRESITLEDYGHQETAPMKQKDEEEHSTQEAHNQQVSDNKESTGTTWSPAAFKVPTSNNSGSSNGNIGFQSQRPPSRIGRQTSHSSSRAKRSLTSMANFHNHVSSRISSGSTEAFATAMTVTGKGAAQSLKRRTYSSNSHGAQHENSTSVSHSHSSDTSLRGDPVVGWS